MQHHGEASHRRTHVRCHFYEVPGKGKFRGGKEDRRYQGRGGKGHR